jgi:hypothetical protein
MKDRLSARWQSGQTDAPDASGASFDLLGAGSAASASAAASLPPLKTTGSLVLHKAPHGTTARAAHHTIPYTLNSKP